VTSDPWPEHPVECVLQPNINPLGPYEDVWVCQGLPPGNWPLDTGLSSAEIGPTYVTYTFSLTSYAARLARLAALDTEGLARGVAFWHAPPVLPGITNFIWTLPPREATPVTIDVLRGTIHAKIGSLEESANVVHYIPDPDAPIDDAMVATFAAKLALNWTAFMTSFPVGGLGVSVQWNSYFAKSCHWDEVRAAHVQIVAGKAKWAPGAQTVYQPIIATIGNGDSLPAQVASVVTLHSGVRVGSRGRSGRGRVYLGPMGALSVDPATGLFKTGWAISIAQGWKDHMVTAMDTGTVKFKQVILSPKTDARYVVVDVLGGMVPDTQRRRRKSFLELYATAT
jgi:hypothetical protein